MAACVSLLSQAGHAAADANECESAEDKVANGEHDMASTDKFLFLPIAAALLLLCCAAAGWYVYRFRKRSGAGKMALQMVCGFAGLVLILFGAYNMCRARPVVLSWFPKTRNQPFHSRGNNVRIPLWP